MKKFLTIAAFMLFTITCAQADRVRMGVTLQAGYFEADGATEIFSGAHSSGASPGTVNKSTATDGDDAEGEFGYGSIFAEVMASDNIGIGVNYVPMALESETTENTQTTTIAAKSTSINKVQIDFEDLTTIYALFYPVENLFVKAGYMEVEVKTNENLATGGAYGNTTLDGYTVGLGYNYNMDNGVFVRFETNYMDIDGATLTNTNDANKKVTADSITGVSAGLSIGKAF
ncbi:hypothetical protein OA862_01630 [Candidatus Pelagibacter sp.]|nr:hypothetical protein [Candidatus Pelagibacter sp.]